MQGIPLSRRRDQNDNIDLIASLDDVHDSEEPGLIVAMNGTSQMYVFDLRYLWKSLHEKINARNRLDTPFNAQGRVSEWEHHFGWWKRSRCAYPHHKIQDQA